MKRKTPKDVDVYVGSRVRLGRTLKGFSQDVLAGSLNLTFQQVQKYENGMNRIGASRLYDIGKALGKDISWFFEGLEATGDKADEKLVKENLSLLRKICTLTPADRNKVESIINIFTTKKEAA